MKKGWIGILVIAASCSPLRSSPNDEKHQLELTLHEVRTGLDDVRHDMNCFQTELQILEGRIRSYENAAATLKQQDLKMDQLTQQLHSLEKKWTRFEQAEQGSAKELRELASFAKETQIALVQFKERISDLEQDIAAHSRRFVDLAKAPTVNGKIYRVRPGDSLEKIAKIHQSTVEKIKKANNLEQDLIVVGQELKIPD